MDSDNRPSNIQKWFTTITISEVNCSPITLDENTYHPMKKLGGPQYGPIENIRGKQKSEGIKNWWGTIDQTPAVVFRSICKDFLNNPHLNTDNKTLKQIQIKQPRDIGGDFEWLNIPT